MNLIVAKEASYPKTPWKGYAIIGNGSLCAVYSDDSRTQRKGIQNLYFHDYTKSYIKSTCIDLISNTRPLPQSKKDSIGMADFFTTTTKSFYENNILKEVNCYAHPDSSIILSVRLTGNLKNTFLLTSIDLPKLIQTDVQTPLSRIFKKGEITIAEWSNHTFLIIACRNSGQQASIKDSVIVFFGTC